MSEVLEQFQVNLPNGKHFICMGKDKKHALENLIASVKEDPDPEKYHSDLIAFASQESPNLDSCKVEKL